MRITVNILHRSGIGIIIFLSALVMWAAVRQKNTAGSANKLVAHAQSLLFQSEKMFTAVTDIETNSRAYLLTGEPYFLELFSISKTNMALTQDTLKKQIPKGSPLRTRILFMLNIISKRIDFSDSLVQLKKNNKILSPIELITGSKSELYINQTRQFALEIQAAEYALLQQSINLSKKENNVENIVFNVSIFFMLVLLVLLWLKQKEFLKQEERRKASDLLGELLTAAPDAMVIINEQWKIELVNLETEKMFGYEKKYLLSKPVTLLLPQNYKDCHIRRKDIFADITAINRVPYNKEWVGIKKNGEKFPVEINLSPLHTDNGTLIIASIRDISQRKKAAEQLKKIENNFELLVKGVKDYGIIFIDKNGLVASWNSGAEKIKGYTATDIIGKHFDIFYTEKDKLNGIPENNLQLALQYGHYEAEGWRIRKDGSTFYANIIITALYEDEKFYGFAKVIKDITELNAAQQHIRFLATIADNIQDPVITSDKSFKITQWSHAAEKLFEFTAEEALSSTLTQLLKVIYPNETQDEILVLLEENSLWKGEIIYQTKYGILINGLVTISKLKDASGNNIGTLVLIKDITKQKNAEAALIEINTVLEEKVTARTAEVYKSEKRFRALTENNYDIISLMDKNFRFVYHSPSAYRITGFTNEETKDMDGTQNLHPDDAAKTYKRIKELMENPGKALTTKYRTRHKNGHYIWVEGIITNLLDDEDIKAIVFNFRNVTERIEAVKKVESSEKMYRSLFENMLHGFAYCVAIYKDGRLNDFIYLAVNNEYELLMGIKGITGKKISAVMPELFFSDESYQRIIEEVLLTGNAAKFETYVSPWDKWISVSVYSPQKNYFVLLLDNITERKKAEEKVKKINIELEQKVAFRTKQLKKSNEELEAFSYSISHDLRAPLRAIVGFTSILEYDYINQLDDEAKRLASVIKNNTLKMGKLIDGLLSFSRLSRRQLTKTNISMREVVNELVAEANTPVIWTVAQLPNVKADITAIRQVWVNLISNAIKYSAKNKHPVIEIGVNETTKENVFFIKDNGVGFDLKYKEKLFKVFQRLHNDTEFEGTGVGLAIVEKIITKHGGKVWANAIPGQGACFYFSLPK